MMIVVGKVGAPHGIKGWWRIHSFTHDPSSLATFFPLFLDEETCIEAWNVFKPTAHPKVFLGHWSSITSRDQASLWTGSLLKIAREKLPKLDVLDNSYYAADLQGLEVYTIDKRYRGRVRALHNFGGGDIVEIENEKETFMISFQQVQEVNNSFLLIKEP